MKVYEFGVNYDAHVCICIGGLINDFKKFLRQRYSGRIPPMWTWDKGEQKRVFVKEMFGTDGFSVWIDYNPPARDEMFYMWIETIDKHLIHEITHVTGHIMFVRGYVYNQAEENWAYMNQEIWDRLKVLLDADKN